MKRLALVLLLLFSLCNPAFGASGVDGVENPAAVDGVSSPASVDGVAMPTLDWTNILLFWRAESLTMSNPGDCYQTDDTWTDAGAVLTEAAKYSGTYGVDADASSEHFYLDDTGIVDGTSGRIGWWHKLNATPNGDNLIVRLFEDSSNYISIIALNGDDEIEVVWYEAGSFEAYCYSSGANLTTTYKFVEVAWDSSVGAGSDYIKIYVNGSEVTGTGCTGETLDPIAVDRFDLGIINTVTSGDHYSDVYISSNDPTQSLYGGGSGHAFQTSCP